MSREIPDDAHARALDALLGTPAQRASARAELEAQPSGAEQLRVLADGLRQAREELRGNALSPAREARLVAGVLAATTRQDLSWRGDLRLLLDFLRARLRSSPASCTTPTAAPLPTPA